MDLFTVGGNTVLAGGTPDDIMAGSAGYDVASCVRFEEDDVVSLPAVNRVSPEAVDDLVPRRSAEDHVGAVHPGDPVLPSAAVGHVGPRVPVNPVMAGAAVDGVGTLSPPTPTSRNGRPPSRSPLT
jgi:hypothetical protein